MQRSRVLKRALSRQTWDTFENEVVLLLRRVLFGTNRLCLLGVERSHSRHVLVDKAFPKKELPQSREAQHMTLLLKEPCVNELSIALVEELVRLGGREVEERFTYRGFNRFSRSMNVVEIAELSLRTRRTYGSEKRDLLQCSGKKQLQS